MERLGVAASLSRLPDRGARALFDGRTADRARDVARSPSEANLARHRGRIPETEGASSLVRVLSLAWIRVRVGAVRPTPPRETR
jgi:hypothetical protein